VICDGTLFSSSSGESSGANRLMIARRGLADLLNVKAGDSSSLDISGNLHLFIAVAIDEPSPKASGAL